MDKLKKKLRKLELAYEKAGPVKRARILKAATSTQKKIDALSAK